jgi:hypothetical protein
VIVGAHYEDAEGSNAGAAYIFKRDGAIWTEHKKLVAIDAEGSDEFGNDVAIFGDYAIAGAPFEDEEGSAAGAAYVFFIL